MTQPMHRCPAAPGNQREPTVSAAEQDALVVLSCGNSQCRSSPPRSERRNPGFLRHQDQSTVAVADIGLDRDPCRVVAVQPDPKPLHPGGSR